MQQLGILQFIMCPLIFLAQTTRTEIMFYSYLDYEITRIVMECNWKSDNVLEYHES